MCVRDLQFVIVYYIDKSKYLTRFVLVKVSNPHTEKNVIQFK